MLPSPRELWQLVRDQSEVIPGQGDGIGMGVAVGEEACICVYSCVYVCVCTKVKANIRDAIDSSFTIAEKFSLVAGGNCMCCFR